MTPQSLALSAGERATVKDVAGDTLANRSDPIDDTKLEVDPEFGTGV
jgi:hypothetical protein